MKQFNFGVIFYTCALLILKYLCGLDISSWLIWTPLAIYALVWIIIIIFYFGMVYISYASLYVTLLNNGEDIGKCTIGNASKAASKISRDFSLYNQFGRKVEDD